MEEDLASNVGFIMGNRQRERIVQVLGSKGKMPLEKIAKFEHIPIPTVKRILDELAKRNIVAENDGIWSLTDAGLTIEREMKKRA
ncbi:MAG: transcriptional regulator [Methanotrichaceae archaeon]|nr:transcriptional regulator [Methanotrichaceae archaeon]